MEKFGNQKLTKISKTPTTALKMPRRQDMAHFWEGFLKCFFLQIIKIQYKMNHMYLIKSLKKLIFP